MTGHVLIGGGAFARELHDWFAPSLEARGDRFVGYLDDTGPAMRGFGHELPHLGPIEADVPPPGTLMVMAIGCPRGKHALATRLMARGARFATLIHPTAWVSRSARIGQGVIVGMFADISANCTLADFTTVNGHSSVGHDAILGAFATLACYVDLTGGTTVGPLASVGSGARILPGVAVGARTKIGAGAVVVRSVGEDITLYAAPARRL